MIYLFVTDSFWCPCLQCIQAEFEVSLKINAYVQTECRRAKTCHHVSRFTCFWKDVHVYTSVSKFSGWLTVSHFLPEKSFQNTGGQKYSRPRELEEWCSVNSPCTAQIGESELQSAQLTTDPLCWHQPMVQTGYTQCHGEPQHTQVGSQLVFRYSHFKVTAAFLKQKHYTCIHIYSCPVGWV